MNMLLKVAACFLIFALTACNKTGAYGFKEGQTYVATINLGWGLYKGNNVKVLEATRDYVIFTREDVEPPHPWYNRRADGEDLERYARYFVLKE